MTLYQFRLAFIRRPNGLEGGIKYYDYSLLKWPLIAIVSVVRKRKMHQAPVHTVASRLYRSDMQIVSYFTRD